MTASTPLWLLYAQLAQHRDDLIDELLDDPTRAADLAHLDNALEELRPVLPGYARVALEILRHKRHPSAGAQGTRSRDRASFHENSGEIPPH